jgi:hypothetical protein
LFTFDLYPRDHLCAQSKIELDNNNDNNADDSQMFINNFKWNTIRP